jgi:uncharacterized membrane protein
MSSVLIFTLSSIGLWISIYFTSVFYKWVEPEAFWIPKVCQLKEATCMSILDTPRAKMFGYPNSVFGIVLFSYLIVSLFLPLTPYISIGMLTIATLRSVYLAYSLIFVTRVPCPLCFTSHVICITLLITVLKLTFFS